MEKEKIAPELQDVKFSKLNLSTMRSASVEVLGYKPGSRKLREAYAEILNHLRGRGDSLGYLCGHCKSPVDGDMLRCWACASVLDDDEPRVDCEEKLSRAEALGIDPTGMDEPTLTSAIEGEERRRVRAKGALTGMESARINERISALLPDRWRKGDSKLYVGYYDPGGVRRVAVYKRGLRVSFIVDDEFLDGYAEVGLAYFDVESRKRLHLGRVNYEYRGDLVRDVEEIVGLVFRRYADGG